VRAWGAAGLTAVALAIVVSSSGIVVLPPLHAGRALAPTSTVPASSPAPATPRAASHTPVDLTPRIRSMEAELRARGVPGQDIHLPQLLRTPGAHVPVSPTYATGPAPMGLADLGLRNASGTLTPYDYNTSSVWGSVSLTDALAAYVDGDGPDTFGLQLNAVATNVTLLGVPGFQFWTQNYLSYTPSTHNLTFGDNVWNFSNASAEFPSDALASYGPAGHPEAPYYYFAVGPSYTVSYPFTVNLYLNATHVGGRPAVYFNYSITKGGAPVVGHGSFDFVVFASSLGVAVAPAPAPAFQVNGTGIGPSGLPNDFELVLVGNDIGDTTTFFEISGTMSLEYWSHTVDRYHAVPAAFDAGSDTGETSNGLLPVTNRSTPTGVPSATLRIGPSFVSGLWNVSGALDGAREFKVSQRPQNAFLFVSPGSTFNESAAQWVPTQRFGSATTSNLWVPNSGTYTLEWMLSDRTVATYPVGPFLPLANSTTALLEHLVVSAAAGSYTPLFAWGNPDLAAISQHGNGTAAAPYVLIHRPVGPLNPVFGQLNDYGFPVFAGILLINTTDPVHILQPPLTLDYGGWQSAELAGLHVPNSNELQLEFWNVTNVTVENSTGLGGWLTYNFDFFPVGSIVFWGSSGNLVANNTFYDQGASIALYGGSGNTLWGNRFLAGAVSEWYYEGNNTTGVLEAESGDLVYNNYFAVGQPAITPTVDLYSCQVLCLNASYRDRWNVSLEPANASAVVLGDILTGSIIRTWYQGGNYWSNYGTVSNPLGVLPYNDSGLISVGGDYVPLYPTSVYAVTFTTAGLLPGSAWGLSIGGIDLQASSGSQVAYEANGSYAYSVTAPSGFLAPAPGTVNVSGANVTVLLGFTEVFAVDLSEAGLVPGWQWNVSFVNVTPSGTSVVLISHGPSAVVELANGTYLLTPSAYGYSARLTGTTALSEIVVDGAALAVGVTFSLVPILSVAGEGLAAGAAWTLTVSQGSVVSSLSGVGNVILVFTALELLPGDYTWSVSVAGYSASPASCAGTSPEPVSYTVSFSANATANSAGAPALNPWEIGCFAAIAAAFVGFALAALFYRRKPRPPPAIAPVAAAAPRPAPSGPAPWEESASDAENPSPYSPRR
jgi:parallel beta-helix repeat protein